MEDTAIEYQELLNRLCGDIQGLLGDGFVGLYIHGSLAMGCYNPDKSDIDFVIVCEEEPDATIKKTIIDSILAYVPYAPKKGLEMHLMRRQDCIHPASPPLFLLHYSPTHTANYLRDPDAYVEHMKGEDPDLCAHLTVLNKRGLCWAGEPIAQVFGAVPGNDYLNSILDDATWDGGDAMYHTLNRCRILAYLRDGQILSKREGGEWGLANLPELYAPLIREALSCYASAKEMPASPESDAFCASTLRVIREQAKEALQGEYNK